VVFLHRFNPSLQSEPKQQLKKKTSFMGKQQKQKMLFFSSAGDPYPLVVCT